MSIIRRIVFFMLQFAIVTALITGLCAGVTLHTFGWQYHQTAEFAEKLHTYFKFGLAVAVLYCLVLLCYRLTRKSLEEPSDTPWINPDNI
jgi:cytochrome b subunit of formate dehydrogenase